MDPNARAARGDEGLLFLEFHEQLLRRVNALVNAPPHTVEDACAFAWMQFLRYQPDRDGQWKAWLVRTAQREAWRLHRAEQDVPRAPLGPTRKLDWRSEPADPSDRLADRVDFEEAVQALGELSPRLRRIAFLRATGLHYTEIAEITGDSRSRVAQLVRRSNERLHEAIDRIRQDERDLPPRVRRLRQLESDPPKWLLDEIGPVPQSRGGRVGSATRKLRWRRAALAIDDYRRLSEYTDPEKALGPRVEEPLAALAYDIARRAIDGLAVEHTCGRQIG